MDKVEVLVLADLSYILLLLNTQTYLYFVLAQHSNMATLDKFGQLWAEIPLPSKLMPARAIFSQINQKKSKFDAKNY